MCSSDFKIFKVRFYPIKDVNGGYLYSIHILEDITEAKKAEEKIKEEMEITTHLLMIAETTAHITDVDKLMEQVMRCGHEIMKCDVCLSYLWDEEARKFVPSQCYGLAHELIPIFRTEPLDEKLEFVKNAMEGKKPVVIEVEKMRSLEDGKNTSTSQPLNLSTSALNWLPDIKTITVVPLIGKTDYLGLIIGIYKTSKEFTERDKKLMQGISHQVSTTLEQTSLYTDSINKAMELFHKVETIQVMHEMDRSILSTLESQEILETTTRLIGKVIPCDRATVVLVDRERQGFIYKAGFGVTIVQKEAFIPFKDSSATEEVVKKRRTEYISDIRKLKNLRPIEERFLKDGFLSHIRIPLVVKGEIDGILTVGSKRAAAFTPEDLSTLEKIASQIGVALENARLVSDLEELFLGTVKSLASAIDAKSRWTAGHSERVTRYAINIGKEMGFSKKELQDLEIGGLLHDIGKLGTYEAILDKAGKLTDEEINMIKQHPLKGAEILSPIKQLKNCISAAKYHHEYYNGKGYPEGLKGEEIPLTARIICIADSVDAMGADRPYRKGKPMDEIVAELKRWSGTQFDKKVVEAFLRVI